MFTDTRYGEALSCIGSLKLALSVRTIVGWMRCVTAFIGASNKIFELRLLVGKRAIILATRADLNSRLYRSSRL